MLQAKRRAHPRRFTATDPPTPVESERETLGTYDLPDISCPADEQLPVSALIHGLQTGTGSRLLSVTLGGGEAQLGRALLLRSRYAAAHLPSTARARPVFVCLSLRTNWLYSIHA